MIKMLTWSINVFLSTNQELFRNSYTKVPNGICACHLNLFLNCVLITWFKMVHLCIFYCVETLTKKSRYVRCGEYAGNSINLLCPIPKIHEVRSEIPLVSLMQSTEWIMTRTKKCIDVANDLFFTFTLTRI